MPFSKFDPHAPVEETPQANTASGARRVLILKWVTRIVFVYTALGFGIIAYLLFR